jgi:hypothetical protein
MSEMRLRLPAQMDSLREDLVGFDGSGGLVFAADPEPPADYGELEDELLECFRLTREASVGGAPIVYVLSQADLLGHRGALGAMRAGALLSAMRSLAFEGVRAGRRANAIAVNESPDLAALARWVRVLLIEPDLTGELVRLAAADFGRLVP